jgi:hypothetical protein
MITWIIVYIGQCLPMVKMYREKSSKSMYIAVPIIGIAFAGIWTLFAIFAPFDFLILIPNIVGKLS